MSGSCVVISEPQAGRQEAAKQLVIWCGLRYHSLGVKLCVCVCPCVCAHASVSERHTELQVLLLGPSHLCTKRPGSYIFYSRDDAKIKKKKRNHQMRSGMTADIMQ